MVSPCFILHDSAGIDARRRGGQGRRRGTEKFSRAPYSGNRKEEYRADAHGIDILRRAGFDGKTLMVNTLTWLQQTDASGGGFFATRPAIGDRIQAVQRMK